MDTSMDVFRTFTLFSPSKKQINSKKERSKKLFATHFKSKLTSIKKMLIDNPESINYMLKT